MDYIFTFFEELTMLGPGDDRVTREIIDSLEIPESPVILDIGSGKGRQTRVLAAAKPDSRIIAADIHLPYLRELVAMREVSPVCGSMDSLPCKKSSVDLIWSEGAIYTMGFSAGLTAWRPLLKEGGHLVVSEICWHRSDPPEELRRFWEEDCPGIGSDDDRIRDAEDAGYSVIATPRLSRKAWEEYYTPVIGQIEIWKKIYDTPGIMDFLSEMEKEIRIFREYGSYYGYTFFILKKDGSGL
ncbi:hypothetical protein RJ53_08660 [Methanocalculus chunghsingensis]|uniref:Methyltransferase type 11 domain-containing protein n=1 Tax=Methanocalculus chunghsingensis TaxID=156457 RepID=A0A8J8B5W3_9EURY|nr:class I SAM-dependent methyltransferase [Methanocalculus chunghsingensis]MBR1369553.1 hypothetical protein [Methanocalculus chunghsingensis]